jgi:DNA-binding GntR family transcriptional regulator
MMSARTRKWSKRWRRPRRDGHGNEAERLTVSAGTIVMVIQRPYWTSGRPAETADIACPVDRYKLLYVIPSRE